VWLLLLSANAPDGDIVFALQGPFRYFEAHRGYSHCLVCLPLLALLCVALVSLISRQRLPWWRAWFLCVIGIASHLLLDLTNSYGIRLSLPFSSRWYHLDLNSLYDIWILAALMLAAIAPVLVWMVNREIGDRKSSSGRGLAIAALLFFVAFDFARLVLHNRTVAQLNSLLYDNAPALQTAALPDSFNPLRWTGIIETNDAFLRLETSSLAQPDPSSAETFYKPALTPSIEAAKTVDPFRYFVYFARFPVWSEQPVLSGATQNTRVDLSDLRFGAPGRGSFHCIGLVKDSGQLTGKWFTFGTGAEFGLAGK
jgi:inner membrane protein